MNQLRRQWLQVAIFGTAVWLACFLLLRSSWPLSLHWLALSGALLAYVLWILWRGLPFNIRPGETQLLPSLGPGNLLSLARGLCIVLIAGFLFGPWPPGAIAWAIVVLYTAADIADFLDGYVARRSNHVTELGGRLDGEFDSLGTLVVIALAISFGQLPLWFLPLGLARYLFLLGIGWRERRGLPVYDLPPSIHRRVFAGFLMAFLSAVLWPILPSEVAVLAGVVFGGATAAGFVRDWLVVSGRVSPESAGYKHVQQSAYDLLGQRLPLIWRGLLVIAIGSMLLLSNESSLRPSGWQAILQSWRAPASGTLTTLLALTAIVGTAFAALGLAGRLASFAVVIPTAFDIAARGLQWDNGLAMVCATCLMLFGTGMVSLWQPEDHFLLQRLGGPT